MVPRILLTICLLMSAASGAAADRPAELKKLVADYEAELKEFYERDVSHLPAEKIDWYKSYPRWKYLPKILALAEADPGDATALEASKLIVGQNGRLSIGCQWKPLYEAEKTAWRIIGQQKLTEEDCSQLCLVAAGRQSPVREAFLRGMARRTDLPGNAHAFAELALAECLAARVEDAEARTFAPWWEKPEDEFFEFLRTQLAEEWIKYENIDDPKPLRAESIERFRRVLHEYGDVPVTAAARHLRADVKTLGDQATRRLYALEHLVIGAEAPEAAGKDLEGNPLRLADYRGKVVLLSFWFTGCAPCMEAIPAEREVVEKFRDRPFALLGACRDFDVAKSKQTAKEHGITWPCWFDEYPGKITEAFGVRGFPAFYLLDAEGHIGSKDVPSDKLVEAIEAVLRQPAASSGESLQPGARD